MYCVKCDKYFEKNCTYCNLCGEKLIEKDLPKKNKSKKKLLIIFGIIISIILIITSTIFCVYSIYKYETKIASLEYIKLGSDEIPTIYKYNKDIKIDFYEKSIENNEIEVEIEYYDDIYKYDILNNYINDLEQNGFDKVMNENGEWYLVKKSNEQGKLILIKVYQEYDRYDTYNIIEYEKINGRFEDYVETINYKRVGEEKYGYIDIDSKWNPIMEEKDMIQYGTNYERLTLYYIENPNFNQREYMNGIYEAVYAEGAENIKIEEVTVDGYNAYQLSGVYSIDNTYIAIWCFLDDNNIMHYIEIDSTKYNSETFSQISSYSVLK